MSTPDARLAESVQCCTATRMTALGQLHVLPRRSIAVCFTPVGGNGSRSQAFPSRPISRHMQCSKGRSWVALVHSITSSAIASMPGGIVRPSALAVLRFITSSKVVG
jgi:hypothetical protein